MYCVKPDGAVTAANRASAAVPNAETCTEVSHVHGALSMAQANVLTGVSAGDTVYFSATNTSGADTAYDTGLVVASSASDYINFRGIADGAGNSYPVIAVSSGASIHTNYRSYIDISGFSIQYRGSNCDVHVAIAGAVSHIRLSNLAIDGNGYGYPLNAGSSVSNVVIDSVHITNPWSYSVWFSGASNSGITMRNLTTAGGRGISLSNVSGLTITNMASGATSSPSYSSLALNGCSGVLSISNYISNASAGYGLEINSCTFSAGSSINGLNIASAGVSGAMIRNTAVQSLILDSPTITGSNGPGGCGLYLLDVAGGVSILNGSIHDNGGTGIFLDQVPHAVIRGNDIYNNGSSGISLQATAGDCNGVVIDHNYIHANGLLYDSVPGNQDGIDGHTNTADMRIYSNIISGNGNAGLAFVQNSSGSVYNNIIRNNGTKNSTYKKYRGGYYNTGTGAVTLKNNIFVGNYGSEMYGQSTGLAATASDNNIFLHAGNGITNEPFAYRNTDGTSYPLLAHWQYVYGQDLHSAGADPGFVSSSDFNLQDTSPAIDAGTHIEGITRNCPGACTDYAGNPVYGLPDIGAYEYQPPYTMGTDEVSTSAPVRVYGDGKFRNTSAPAGGETADMSVAIAGSDTLAWLDIQITDWQTDGARAKAWTEGGASSSVGNTVHTIGDLRPDTRYTVTVDSVLGADITGCPGGVCLSDADGKITFTYTGGYPAHTVHWLVEPQDTVEVRADGQYSTIADAIAAVKEGGAVTVAPGSYGGFEIWKPGLTIIGSRTGSNAMPVIQGAPVDYVSEDGSTRQAAVYIRRNDATVMGFSIAADSGYDTAVAVDEHVSGTHLHFNNLVAPEESPPQPGMVGIENLSSSPVDARMNWWGDDTGPSFVGRAAQFDACSGLSFDSGRGALLKGGGCFKTSLFKPFLGTVGLESLGAALSPVEALAPLEAAGGSVPGSKVAVASFSQSPVEETVSDDPYAYLAMMPWDAPLAGERALALDLCRYVDSSSAAYWTDGTAAWQQASRYSFAGSCLSLDIDTATEPGSQDVGRFFFAVSATEGYRDSDSDGTVDGEDNCPDAANPDQLDYDGDGLGNACDPSPGCPECPEGTVCNASTGECGQCAADTDCPDDTLFCTGPEICAHGTCISSGNPCAHYLCDEDTNRCVECLGDGDCGGAYCVGNACVECRSNADCSDGLYCNGAETCAAGACAAGTPPACDDGAYCNGAEACSEAAGSCSAGSPPCSGATPVCDEAGDRCVECMSDAQCDDVCVGNVCVECRTNADCSDGRFCTGAETCAAGACSAGVNPCGGASPVCNEATDSCVECLNNTHCDPGYTCSGTVCVPAGTARIGKATVKAGKTDASDSIQFSGWMDATAADFNAALGGRIIVTIDAADVPDPAETTFAFPVTAATLVKGTYKSPKDTMKAFSFDSATGLMKFSAGSADLTGVSCPVTVTIQFGDYAARVQMDEGIVNGAKPCPLPLLMGVKDVLNVDRAAARKGAAPGTDSIRISGGFTVDGPFSPTRPLIITLGPDAFTVPGGDFLLRNGSYSCKSIDAGNAYVSAQFDTVKCTYSIRIKGADITGSGRVGFGLNVFGNALNSARPVTLPPEF